MRVTAGTCQWCGCQQATPCPGGCGWANAAQTLCTACVDVEREWQQQVRKPTNMRRAFFRGFMVGADDPRAEEYRYSRGAAQWNFWERARALGRRALRA
jgi:hypothetical protein